MGKYYAVKAGRKEGIYSTWDECKAQVDGFSGAVYKSFSTYEEAENFISKNANKPRTNKVDLKAYVDGSYDNYQKYYSYACVIFYDNKRIELAAADNDPKIVEQRNVAGEVNAVISVINFALENKVKSLEIYYDYAGIEKWATKEWQAKNEFTQSYAKFMSTHSASLDIHFIKVKSHSGDEFNDLVDSLAKEALLNVNNPINRMVDLSNDNTKDVKKQESDADYEVVLNNLKSTKKSINLGLVYQKKVITTEDLYEILKSRWKNKSNKIGDISEIKSAFNLETNELVFLVTTKTNEKHVIKINKGEW